jgi:hypothetical protein
MMLQRMQNILPCDALCFFNHCLKCNQDEVEGLKRLFERPLFCILSICGGNVCTLGTLRSIVECTKVMPLIVFIPLMTKRMSENQTVVPLQCIP